MKHYLFVCTLEDDECEGEQFLVGAFDEEEATEIAEENFGQVELLDTLTEEEAENSGLDEW